MRRRLMLITPSWSSVMRPNFPALYASVLVTAFMRIGRCSMCLILILGKNIPPGLQRFLENMGLSTNAQPTSRPCSVHREHTTENVSQESLRFCNERALSVRSV
jgi:hypothetical protein